MSRSRRRRKQVVALGVRMATPEEPVAGQEQRDRCGDEEPGGLACTGTFLNSACVPGMDGSHAHQVLLKDLVVGPSVAGEFVLVHCNADSGDDPESWAAGDVVEFGVTGTGGEDLAMVPGSLRRVGINGELETLQEEFDGDAGFVRMLSAAAGVIMRWIRGQHPVKS